MKNIKTLLIAFFVALALHGQDAGLTTDLPRSETDSRVALAVERFRQALMDADTTHTTQFYSLVAMRHGCVVYDTGFDCPNPRLRRESYSIGKTLVALGVGCAMDEGRLRLEDRVVDFFPDKLPAHVPEGMRRMTVRHLLTMHCGMKENEVLMSLFKPARQGKDTIDWVREFFASPMTHEPGTYFYYNLFATYIVCAIVEKVTGQPFMDYITPRLLKPLGIEGLEWDRSPQGICIGAWGVKLGPEELAKIGQLMLNGGKWQGQRLVSKRWMKQMTRRQVESAPNVALAVGKPLTEEEKKHEIHSQGYGYFVWRGHGDTYRAEGLGGQAVVVSPGRDAVLVITLKTPMYKEFYDLIDEYLIPVM